MSKTIEVIFVPYYTNTFNGKTSHYWHMAMLDIAELKIWMAESYTEEEQARIFTGIKTFWCSEQEDVRL